MNTQKLICFAASLATTIAADQIGAAVVNITEGLSSGYTMTHGNTYVVKNSVSCGGMYVADGATVVLYVPKGVTLSANGGNGNGGAGICVPARSTLIITGEGTVNATGGSGANGGRGNNGSAGTVQGFTYGHSTSGSGGAGGKGGGGGGAGIGGSGGYGGSGGVGGTSITRQASPNPSNLCGNGQNGTDGGNGSAGQTMGTVYVIGTITVNASGGAGGSAGNGGNGGGMQYVLAESAISDGIGYFACSGGGGGQGGAGSSPSCGIGGGGASGGGGGGGGSGALLGVEDIGLGAADYTYSSNCNAHGGGGGKGGSSSETSGSSGYAAKSVTVRDYTGNIYGTYCGGIGGTGGAAGSAGEAGTLYVSSTAKMYYVSNYASRQKSSASTHSAAEYTITFNPNGGTLASSTHSVTATLGCALPNCISSPFKENNEFLGWATEPNGGDLWYGAGGSKKITAFPVARNVTLYAKWSRPSLDVQSRYGVANPEAGVHTYSLGTTITASVAPPAPTDDAKVIFVGWTGTGSVPRTGNTTNASFTITQDSTITWNWERQNRISVSVPYDGLCEFGTQWVKEGQTVQAMIVPPNEDRYYLGLRGDTNGVLISGMTLSIPSDGPRVIDILICTCNRFVGSVQWAQVSSANDWVVSPDTSAEDGFSLRSASAETGTASTNSATVNGSGALSFDWRISANRGDYARLYVDGVQKAQISRKPEWSPLSVQIEGDGDHIVSWVYDRKSNTPANDNAAYIDNVSWQSVSAVTCTTPTPVPYAWIDKETPTLLMGYNGNYEAVANSTAANGVNKVWECYVAGVCPTNANAKFMAIISIGEKGQPCISWHPDLNEGGTRQERVYRVLGSKVLGQAARWVDVPSIVCSEADGYRFFKVVVEMPQSETE